MNTQVLVRCHHLNVPSLDVQWFSGGSVVFLHWSGGGVVGAGYIYCLGHLSHTSMQTQTLDQEVLKNKYSVLSLAKINPRDEWMQKWSSGDSKMQAGCVYLANHKHTGQTCSDTILELTDQPSLGFTFYLPTGRLWISTVVYHFPLISILTQFQNLCISPSFLHFFLKGMSVSVRPSGFAQPSVFIFPNDCLLGWNYLAQITSIHKLEGLLSLEAIWTYNTH